MANKKSIEAMDNTLRDIRKNPNIIFGGTMILLAGDFRQTLPVIPRGTPADELHACLKSSLLWRYVKTLRLTTNMRVQLQNDSTAERFSKQLLDIGDGKLTTDTSGLVALPDDFCTFVDSQVSLIDQIFPNIAENHKNYSWLSERAILAAKNIDVHAINSIIQSRIPGDLRTYKSVDQMCDDQDAVNYPTEFLNSLDVPGFPPHKLELKVGSVIIMLRNLNQPRLCNGTRLAIIELSSRLIEATILKGKYRGENVFIPRIPMIQNDLPFTFKRLQFPVRLAFAITINKSQGQSLSLCGINLENSCFSHGQLYVACSRVGKPSALFVYTNDKKTKNVVYPQALQ